MMLLSNLILLSSMMLYDLMLFTFSKPTAVAPETRRKSCPKPTLKTPERSQIVNFEQANTRWGLLNSYSVE